MGGYAWEDRVQVVMTKDALDWNSAVLAKYI